MRLGFGFLILALGLLASLFRISLRERRFFDRPTLARSRFFDPLLNGARWILILSGIAILASASSVAGIAASATLLLLVAYLRFIRSVWFQKRLLVRDFARIRRERPGAPEQELLFEFTSARHPRWGSELIEQMVADYPTIETLAPMIVKMERGFRGFRPG